MTVGFQLCLLQNIILYHIDQKKNYPEINTVPFDYQAFKYKIHWPSSHLMLQGKRISSFNRKPFSELTDTSSVCHLGGPLSLAKSKLRIFLNGLASSFYRQGALGHSFDILMRSP